MCGAPFFLFDHPPSSHSFFPFVPLFFSLLLQNTMSFFADKGGTSTLHNSSHLDQTLATGSHYTQSSSTSSYQGFRDTNKGKTPLSLNQEFQQFSSSPIHASSSHLESLKPAPPPDPSVLASIISPLDGAEVFAFLDHGDYEQEVNGDDLIEGSMSYRSYQHQADHQHSLAELALQRQRALETWMLSEDIVDYIDKSDSAYVDDVYGLPPVIQSLVKEAKEELNAGAPGEASTGRAVNRLRMIRDHLISRSQGDPRLAAQQTMSMSNDDWASMFPAM
ncbi:hypothetical protein DM01DRAFT_339174 [Hesseltinella vesiculosa]|uniref:Uncharacterized protein n=1 Tax=Hesseltinella vesiculosa TaxID=101127 RepID=A0A1X2GB58_9FUNG|nr:hypothetical protein DM01DRAFT_339174 [Hesseltinella vesiculosa]